MELCQLNLQTYIKKEWTASILEEMQHLTVAHPKTRLRNSMFIMLQVANGVSHIHRMKEVHRDLKPSNGKIDMKVI
jgi:serine/threonine protein kinase